MFKYYILDEKHNIIEVDDAITWGKFFNKKERIVKQEYVGKHWVSTVFLGLEHGYENGRPLLFETMVFLRKRNEEFKLREPDDAKNDVWHDYQVRYTTWDEALKGHRRTVRKVRKSEKE